MSTAHNDDEPCPPTLPSTPRGAAVHAERDPVAAYISRLGSEKSRHTMRSALAAIAVEIGARSAEEIPWRALRYGEVLALRARLLEKYSAATVNRNLAALRGVAREAMRLELLPPAEFARIQDVENVRGSRLPAGRHVQRDELVALFNGCGDSVAGARDAALMAVLRLGGLRRAELVLLDLLDLDRETYALRVMGKGNKERLVYLQQGRAELERWLAHRGLKPGPLFYAVSQGGLLSGRPLAESSVAYIVRRMAARARVAHLSPHDLRRTFVGDLLDQRADLVTVQKLAGHADIKTTARYDRRAERASAATATLLDVPRR